MKKYDSSTIEYAKSIRNEINEKNREYGKIDSPESLEVFLKNEKLYKTKFFSRIKQFEKLAQDIVDGKLNVEFDLDKLPPKERSKAEGILTSLKYEVNQIKDPTYNKTYQIITTLIYLIGLLSSFGALLFMGNSKSKNKDKSNQFLKLVRKIKDVSSKTPNNVIPLVKNIMNLFK
jgi:hypothetical protein